MALIALLMTSAASPSSTFQICWTACALDAGRSGGILRSGVLEVALHDGTSVFDSFVAQHRPLSAGRGMAPPLPPRSWFGFGWGGVALRCSLGRRRRRRRRVLVAGGLNWGMMMLPLLPWVASANRFTAACRPSLSKWVFSWVYSP